MTKARTFARCAAWAFAAPALAARPAAAQETRPKVAFVVVPCAEGAVLTREDEAAKLLALELQANLVAPDATVTTVQVTCAPPLVSLSVDDPITRKSVSRKIEIANYPETARARVVAIAAAELVSASWSEAAMNPTPKVTPAGPPPLEAERRAVVAAVPSPPPASSGPQRSERNAIVGAVLVRGVFSEVAQVGGTLRLTSDVLGERAGLGLSLDASAAQGRAKVDLGHVTANTVDLSGGLYAFARAGSALHLRAGAGVRVGHAGLDGRPSDASTTTASDVSGVYTAPHLSLAARVLTKSALLVEAGVEVGTIALGPKGTIVGTERVDAVALQGLYAAPTLGAGARF